MGGAQIGERGGRCAGELCGWCAAELGGVERADCRWHPVEKLVAFSAPIWVAEKAATWVIGELADVGGGQTAGSSVTERP